jgi:hypothetical protein
MSDKQAEEENVYKKYSIRSEHTLCVMANECNFKNYSKSSLWIEGKLWFILIIILLFYFFYIRIFFCREFTYESSKYHDNFLELKILKKKSPARNVKTTAEILLCVGRRKKNLPF